MTALGKKSEDQHSFTVHFAEEHPILNQISWQFSSVFHPSSDGEMFTASQYEFRSSPDVRRNFPFPTLRTEEAPTRWLLGNYII